MASIYDRILGTNDYATDGGILFTPLVRDALTLFSNSQMTAAQVKTLLGCTGTQQENEVQAILNTMPATLLSFLNVLNRSEWPERVTSILHLGGEGWTQFDTEAKMKTALGV